MSSVRSVWFAGLLVLCSACQTARVHSASDAALRLRVARAELQRVAGIDTLIALAVQGATPARVLALRGLGRVGAPLYSTASPVRSRSIDVLIAALRDPEPQIVVAAAGALSVMAGLDALELGVDAELLAALEGAGAGRASVVEALGTAGSAVTQPALLEALQHDATAEVAALALGRHGRRAIPLSADARAALVVATAHAAAGVRQAALFALARETEPPESGAVRAALWARLADPSGDVRVQAIDALSRRKLLGTAADGGEQAERLLQDRDFRVAATAARALAAHADSTTRVTSALGPWLARLAGGEASLAHVIIEAERALAPTPLAEADCASLSELAAAAAGAQALSSLTRGWIVCLAEQALLRAQSDPDYTTLAGCGLEDAWRLPLVAELIGLGVGSLDTRRTALAGLLAHADPRVRSAGVGVLAALAKSGEEVDRRYVEQQLVAALAAPDLMVAAAAVEAARGVYEALSPDAHAALDAALLERVGRERDPEVGAALLGLVAERKLDGAADSCRAGLTGTPVLAAAAAQCLIALGASLPERAAVAALPALPADIDAAAVIGKQLRWHLQTTRGAIDIALRPDVAPWTVATIAALTRRGSYDGLAFHRVVPGFVVQGGDPTESGYGGPGFAIPVEPATLADSTGFARGGVGIADAGRDSGGSQFFIMHGRASYLDARYSYFGSVEQGQENAEALLIGDEITSARIEVLDR
jgi:cyclophilin family peptidyl-prolyl cis-trans isomerase